MKSEQEFWTCVIGPASRKKLPFGANSPMTSAVQSAFSRMTGENAEFCLSGWGNDSKTAALAELKRDFIYAVEKINFPEPELRKLTTGELLRLLTNFAKDYVKISVKSVRQNSHMNKVTIEEDVEQIVVDAVITDFINYIAGRYGMDYGFHTKHLKEAKETVDFAI